VSAEALRLVDAGLEAALLPPEKLTVAEYAAQHRWLANEGGGYVGRWQHAIVPYLVAPMEALTAHAHDTVAVVGPGQSAKTSIAENWFLHTVGADPADLLWYMQTDAVVNAYVKDRIEPMIATHEAELANRLGLRAIDDSLHFKRFRGAKVQWLSANKSNLISKSAPRIVLDEIDAYLGSLGDVKALADIRRQAFGSSSKLLALSHPDRAAGPKPADWKAGIMAIYADSDRRRWYWPCPHCNGWSSPCPGAARVMVLDYPADAPLEEIEQAARLICPCCGSSIEDGARREMNAAGVWVGDGQEIAEDGRISGELVRRKIAGFWIVGVMSPFAFGGLGGLARARVKAEREFAAGGEESTVREVVVKQWGIPYTPSKQLGSVAAETLAERAEETLRLGQVPEAVRFLTAAIDVQKTYFDVLVRGWGRDGESWVIDAYQVAAAADLGGDRPLDPAARAEDWDLLIARVLTRRWPLATDRSLGMALRAVGFDSGGAPGVTVQAYAAWRRWKLAGLVRGYGKIDGRDVWSVLPLKGHNNPNAPLLQVTYPDTVRKNSRVRPDGTVPLGLFNSSAFKDALAGQLQRALPGARFVHFPRALAAAEPGEAQVWFEQLCAERRRADGRWEKTQANARNEALDLMVMSHALAFGQGLERVRWDNPPPWAAPHATNTLVAPLPAGTAAAMAGPGAAPVVPAAPVAPVGAVIAAGAAAVRSIASRLA